MSHPYQHMAQQPPGKTSGKREPQKLCPVASKCGSCQWINKGYGEQLEAKATKFRRLMEPYCRPEHIIPMDDPNHYRNKVHADFLGACSPLPVVFLSRASHPAFLDSCPPLPGAFLSWALRPAFSESCPLLPGALGPDAPWGLGPPLSGTSRSARFWGIPFPDVSFFGLPLIGCGSAWLERRLREAEVASSNPATPIHAKMARFWGIPFPDVSFFGLPLIGIFFPLPLPATDRSIPFLIDSPKKCQISVETKTINDSNFCAFLLKCKICKKMVAIFISTDYNIKWLRGVAQLG